MAGGSHNLVSAHDEDARTACSGITQTGDPLLAPLALNAPGRTPTRALDPFSPAIDTGDPAYATLDDQRGVDRSLFGVVDIGAYEYSPGLDLTAPVAAPSVSPAPNVNGWNKSAVTVSWNWADELAGTGIDAANCTPSSVTTAEGNGIGLAATCADIAGNVGTGSATVNVDLTPPMIACDTPPTIPVGSPGGTVTGTMSDSLSGTDGATATGAPAPVQTATVGIKYIGIAAVDRAGNTTAVTCSYVVSYGFSGFL